MEPYVEHFVAEAVTAVQKLAGVNIEQEAVISVEKSEVTRRDISAVIGLNGKAHGALVISMSVACGLKLVEKMTGGIYNDINSEVADVIGELASIISGMGKKHFEQTTPMSLSVPSFVIGDPYLLTSAEKKRKVYRIIFKIFETEKLSLSVTMTPVATAATA
jgi:chemotaxis protein CheX